MKYQPIPRELLAATTEARERATAHWETDVRPAMQPPKAKAIAPKRTAEEQRADPLPPLSEYALMTKAERAQRILGENHCGNDG